MTRFWEKASQLVTKLTNLSGKLSSKQAIALPSEDNLLQDNLPRDKFPQDSLEVHDQALADYAPSSLLRGVRHFVDISPNIVSPTVGSSDFSVTLFKGDLYLASIQYAPDILEERREILRFNSTIKEWQVVYQDSLTAVLARGISTKTAPKSGQAFYAVESEIFVLFDEQSKTEILYISFCSENFTQLLKSQDGALFETVRKLPTPVNPGQPGHCFIQYKNQIYGIPFVGTTFAEPDLGASIYTAKTPESDSWKAASLLNFEDSSNQSITGLVVFQEALYASTFNPSGGFQLWKTTAEGEAPYSWERVLDRGAYGYSLNQTITSMAVFQDSLYLASSIPSSDRNEALGFYWAGSEIFRIYPDQDWDLVVGVPKYTPLGLKVPLSVMGPGFDSPPAAPVRPYLVVHNDLLYAAIQNLNDFNLWLSGDGEQWHAVPLESVLDAYRVEMREAVSTPFGLVFVLEKFEPTESVSQQVWLAT